jgi:hypothetical protein
MYRHTAGHILLLTQLFPDSIVIQADIPQRVLFNNTWVYRHYKTSVGASATLCALRQYKNNQFYSRSDYIFFESSFLFHVLVLK